ncbi:hypothetical protein PspP139CL_26675, partial [Pseudomonas syringae]|nr:hypothetical protein [Pseudomonas syringae]
GVQNAGRSGSVEIIVQPSGVIPLQRGNAVLDALRRQEDAERRTIVAPAPALREQAHSHALRAEARSIGHDS